MTNYTAATKNYYGTKQNATQQLQDSVRDDLNNVNALIIERLNSNTPLIPAIASHIIAAGGKRFRPLLTLASAKMCGYEGNRHVHLAACVEFIHTATLLHDDVVDESTMRRGLKTANTVWNNQASVLVGDFLFSRSFELMVEDGSLDVLKILSEASLTIAEGEVMQLSLAYSVGLTQDQCLEIIRSKTAVLFSAAAAVGGIISDQSARHIDALRSFGLNMGMAFQLIDDVLDFTSDKKAMGKRSGDDFREGKVTFPIVLAYERSSDEEKRFWQRTLEENDQQEGDFQRAVSLVHETKSYEQTFNKACEYAEKAQESLQIFPDNIYRKLLSDLVAFTTERYY